VYQEVGEIFWFQLDILEIVENFLSQFLLLSVGAKGLRLQNESSTWSQLCIYSPEHSFQALIPKIQMNPLSSAQAHDGVKLGGHSFKQFIAVEDIVCSKELDVVWELGCSLSLIAKIAGVQRSERQWEASWILCGSVRPGISVEPNIFLGNFNQLLVNVNSNHASGLVVLGNADGYVANVAANVKDFLLLKPVAFQVLETTILNLPWVPVSIVLVVISKLELLILFLET